MSSIAIGQCIKSHIERCRIRGNNNELNEQKEHTNNTLNALNGIASHTSIDPAQYEWMFAASNQLFHSEQSLLCWAT